MRPTHRVKVSVVLLSVTSRSTEVEVRIHSAEELRVVAGAGELYRCRVLLICNTTVCALDESSVEWIDSRTSNRATALQAALILLSPSSLGFALLKRLVVPIIIVLKSLESHQSTRF